MTDLNPGGLNSFNSPEYLINNGNLYFSATNASGESVYVIHGGTIDRIFDIPSGFSFDGFSELGTLVFFVINNGSTTAKLYKTQGTAGTTTVLAQFNGMLSGSISMLMTNIGGKLYFTAATDELGTEPYFTDGNTVTLLKDINPGSEGSYALFFNSVVLQNKIIFMAYTDTEGSELWSTDGTSEGTVLLKDIYPGTIGSSPTLMPVFSGDFSTLEDVYNPTANYNGLIFLTANNGNGVELWKTDGSAAGTSMVKELNPGADGAGGGYIYTKSGLVFSGNDGSGFEPWITDGTGNGTRPLADINTMGSSKPEFSFIWNGDIYLNADNGNGGPEYYYDFYKLLGPYAPLPVTLIDFTAPQENGAVQLQWSTSTESNSDKFIILRSSNGEDFNEISSIPAAGNSSLVRKNSYTDYNGYQQNSDKLFYRLKMVDKDGKASLSKIVSVVIPASSSFLSVFPNPAKENLKTAYSTKTESVLTVSDLSGKVLYRTTLPAALKGSVNIDVSTYPKGTYVIRLVEGSIIKTEKFIKK